MKRTLFYSLAVSLVANGYFLLKWQTLQINNTIISDECYYTSGQYDIDQAKLTLEIKKIDVELKKNEDAYRRKYGKEIGQ